MIRSGILGWEVSLITKVSHRYRFDLGASKVDVEVFIASVDIVT